MQDMAALAGMVGGEGEEGDDEEGGQQGGMVIQLTEEDVAKVERLQVGRGG